MIGALMITLALLKLAALTCLLTNQRRYERDGVQPCRLFAPTAVRSVPGRAAASPVATHK